ncbi:MAG: Modification methylase DpnIIA [Syntrophomonadaceae bacterium]|nr:Modification methylase DpnIIA [Bacillota bacterium]
MGKAKEIEPILVNLDTATQSEKLKSEDMLKKFPRSPLRYPGGKNRAIKAIYAYIPPNETKLCSPFLGGASIELACTPKMQVYGYDVFSPLVDFWQALMDDPNLLADRVEHYYPLSRSNFYNLQKRYVNLENKIERAAAFYVLNRSSFSGTTLSGGMSPGHPRFTESSIERLRSFRADNFNVECADFCEVVPKHKDAFLYLDPPYINGQALYGVKGDTHKSFNHQALADILHKRDRWIMSYNDRNEIRELYKDNPILSVEWIYGMSKNKQSSEILVLSKDLVVLSKDLAVV